MLIDGLMQYNWYRNQHHVWTYLLTRLVNFCRSAGYLVSRVQAPNLEGVLAVQYLISHHLFINYVFYLCIYYNCLLINFSCSSAFEHWFGCRATEPGCAGDIGAIEVWLIDWLQCRIKVLSLPVITKPSLVPNDVGTPVRLLSKEIIAYNEV